MSTKEKAKEIFYKHLHLASSDGRLFRKTVMQEMQSVLGVSNASSATHYNNLKKEMEALGNRIEGLGRAPVAPGVRKMGGAKAKKDDDLVADNECFSVIELVNEGTGEVVGRCQSFILQGDASEKFDQKKETWPNSTWVMIQGLGPNSGDSFKLEPGEKEIKRYAPEVAA